MLTVNGCKLGSHRLSHKHEAWKKVVDCDKCTSSLQLGQNDHFIFKKKKEAGICQVWFTHSALVSMLKNFFFSKWPYNTLHNDIQHNDTQYK